MKRPPCTLALILSLHLAFSATLQAQMGVSSAAASRTRYLANLGALPAPREVEVEQLYNFHRHDIGRPKSGDSVALDVRSSSGSAAGEAVLQVGLSTRMLGDRQDYPPLNLAIVIDKSGSMAAADKMSRVKGSLQAMVSRLRPDDTLSVVAFDSSADVAVPSQKVGDGKAIQTAISQIVPGSATDLHAGLMLGYQQALKGYRKGATNRVILLTDGIANRGVTDPEAIANQSLAYNDQGVDLSTIGVGLDLNRDLLAVLAKKGRGLFHFVADGDDMRKVFVDELQSLLAPVALEPKLEIQWGPGLKLARLYGYQPKAGERSVRLDLDNLNSGATQVVLARFQRAGAGIQGEKLTVRLSYFDQARAKQVVKTESAAIAFGSPKATDGADDPEVRKNLTIAEIAQSIKDMALAAEQRQNRKALQILDASLSTAQKRFPSRQEPDVERLVSMAETFRKVLKAKLESEDADVEIDENLIFNGDFSKGNVGFVSELAYSPPAENVLRPSGYTVAKSFNQPLLHRLHPPEPYASPVLRRGDEAVMFANAGGHDTLLMWSSTVKCQPRTRYRISFHAICLNDGPEWVPTYEIRVNGERSDPQLAAIHRYVPITTTWDSGNSRTAEIKIVRLPMAHNGGLVGIAAIEMHKLR
ncbi:MAG TPA: VWA domain-containing protein [Fimbriimonas sp.]